MALQSVEAIYKIHTPVPARQLRFLLGALHPEHVVEEQVVLVRGRQPRQLAARPVQDDPAEQADLGADVEPRLGCDAGAGDALTPQLIEELKFTVGG